MEASTITVLAGAFIGFAIMIAIGVQILGNVQSGTNCQSLPGGFHTGTGTPGGNVPNSIANSTGWALSCNNTNTAIQNGYTLLVVAVIVIAAVIIMFVVKML